MPTATRRPSHRLAIVERGRNAPKIIQIGQGVGEQLLSTSSLSRSHPSRPSAQRRAHRRLLRRRSCFAQARAITALSATCWAAARAPGPLHHARKSTRCARAEATSLSPPGGRRCARSAIQVAADACAARQNAASWSQARLCVMSLYFRDCAQRVRACMDAMRRTLSLVLVNNSSQRELIKNTPFIV